MKYDFYKENKSDKVWWVDTVDKIGEYLFSFDRKKIYNLFSDYPQKLSPEERPSSTKRIPIGKNSSGRNRYFNPPYRPFFCLSFAVLI